MRGSERLEKDVALRTLTNDAGLKNFLTAYTTDFNEIAWSSPAVSWTPTPRSETPLDALSTLNCLIMV